MKYEEFLKELEVLARGQGFYGRVLENFRGLSGALLEEVKNIIEGQNFKDTFDIIMWFEN